MFFIIEIIISGTGRLCSHGTVPEGAFAMTKQTLCLEFYETFYKINNMNVKYIILIS